MSRDIGDEEASPVRVDGYKPVEISCDSSHRTIRGADPQAAEFGNAAGENRGLDLTRDSEFVFDREQAALVGKHFFCCYPPLREHKQRKRQRLKKGIIREG